MTALFTSGRIVDLILGLMVLEALGLAVWRYRTGQGPAMGPFLVNLAAGAALMLALRGALVGATWPWIALGLAGSLLGHAIDLAHRFRRKVG